MYENLKENLTRAIEPLNEYLKTYDKYLNIAKLNIDDYTKSIETADQPRDIESIKDEIAQVYQRKEEIKQEIPENIHVSCFEINCREILIYLEEK